VYSRRLYSPFCTCNSTKLTPGTVGGGVGAEVVATTVVLIEVVATAVVVVACKQTESFFMPALALKYNTEDYAAAKGCCCCYILFACM
jgi:hypothetical protein